MNKILQELKDNDVAVLEIKNKSMVNMIQAKRKGELLYCQETDSFFICDENKWIDYDVAVKAENEGKGIDFSLYELNQQIINGTKPMKEWLIPSIIDNWKEGHFPDETYFMLLCKDISYYTVFAKTPVFEIEKLGDAVLECLKYLGTTYSVNNTEDNSGVEIWLKPKDKDEPVVMYLFPYSTGVITIGG